MTRTITSVIAGTPVQRRAWWPVRRSTNPARLDDVVADVELGDAATFVAATPRGPAGTTGLGRRAGAGARPRDRPHRPRRRG